jgi:hypothetical protein
VAAVHRSGAGPDDCQGDSPSLIWRSTTHQADFRPAWASFRKAGSSAPIS